MVWYASMGVSNRLLDILRTVGMAATVLGLLALPMACSAIIHPPQDVQDPVEVLLLDHGRTASLILPDQTGSAVRWTYGDWNYYALRQTTLWHGAVALFWPSRSALGRKELGGPVQEDSVRHRLGGIGVDQVYVIRVERSCADTLHAELASLYHDNLSSLHRTPEVGLEFVHHPVRYTWFNNSNHMIALWLRRMGCRVSGPTFFSRWRVIEKPFHR